MGYTIGSAALFSGTLAILTVQWVPSAVVVGLTWTALGFLAMQNMVTYAALAPRFPPALTGRLNACLTLSWMIGGFLFQNIYGFVLDLYSPTNGSYPIEGHRAATGVMLSCQVAALAWYFVFPIFIRDADKHADTGA
jgi:hypothetical protein